MASCAVLIAGALATAAPASPQPAHRAAVAKRDSATMTVYWRGNGHGHGMSQYGAEGAALQGLSARQIIAFYYPHTTLATVPSSTIRVRLSDTTTADTTVLAGAPGLTLSGYGALPASGYSLFRLVPAGNGLTLQGRKGTSWQNLKTGLGARADFSSRPGWVQVLMDDGSSTRYHGTVGAVRSGSGEWTINRVAMDLYVQGSVPREVPASWSPAAVQAQAIAARSYAEATRSYSGGPGSLYDICDTTSCQSYGGMAHYDPAGNLMWTDDPAALAGNQNVVLRYQGQPVFAQYSASDGGATVDGGKPYLTAHDDPYDDAASGDPYLNESMTTTVSSVAGNLGLQSISAISSVQRDGIGPWGGRIVSAKVSGTNGSGAPTSMTVDGFTLGDALGPGTDYVKFDAALAAPTAPTSVQASSGEAGATISWSPPADAGSSAVTGYRISVGARTIQAPASARSVWVGPLNNWKASTVWVSAGNAVGYGPAASVAAKGVAVAHHVTALAPQRVIDTRRGAGPVSAANPYQVTVAGLGGIPRSGVTSVQLAITILWPTASGVLRIGPAGDAAPPVAAIAYVKGRSSTATVSVPLGPGGALQFAPSSGSLQFCADQEAFSGPTGSRLAVPTPHAGVTVHGVAAGGGSVLDLSGQPGIGADTTGVVLAVDATGPQLAGLQIWPDGTRAPGVRQVTVDQAASSTGLVTVPLPSSRRLRISSSAPGVTAGVHLVGVLGPSGGGAVTFPPSMLADGGGTRTVGSSPVTVHAAGVNQVAPGARAVLVHVTVTSGSAGGAVWAFPTGTARPDAPVARFGPNVTVTGTALVPIGSGGNLALQSSTAGVRVAVDAIGYVTAR